MKYFFSILLTAIFCATASAQSIRTLGYNSTNGQIVAATNVTWTNSFNFSTNTVAAQVRTNLSLGWAALTNTNAATSFLGFTTNGQVVANTALLKFTNETTFGDLMLNNANGLIFIPDLDGAKDIFYFDGGSDAPVARANLGFSTNLNTLWTATNAATAARVLSGSTNTNYPYSGTVELTNTNAVLTFSNGILQSVQ